MDILEYWPFEICLFQIVAYTVLGVVLILMNEFPRQELDQEHKEVGEYSAKFVEKPKVLRRELWEAWSGALHPGWLLGLRIFAFLYLLGLLVVVFLQRPDWLHVYYYYTEWTLTLLIIYFGWAIVVSILEYKSSICKHSSTNQNDLQASLVDQEEGELDSFASTKQTQTGEAGYLGYSLQILFQIVAPAVVLTDGVYWCLLYPLFPDEFPHTISEINLHAVNGVFMVFELFLNSMRFPWFRAGYFFLYGCFYVFFQWAIYAFGWTNYRWPYPFLDISTGYAPLWYLALALIHIPVYAIVAFLNRLKLCLQGMDSDMTPTARLWSLLQSLWPGGAL